MKKVFKTCIASWLMASVVIVISCQSEQNKKAADGTTTQPQQTQTPPQPPQFPGGEGPGGMARGDFGAGFFVNIPVTSKSTTSSSESGPTNTSVSGFRLECSTANKGPQSIIDLSLTLKRGSPSLTYTTTTSSTTYCVDTVKVTVSPLSAADIATLKVTLKDLTGKAYSEGTSKEFTQEAVALPTPPSEPPTSGQPGQGFTRPEPKEVEIEMTAKS